MSFFGITDIEKKECNMQEYEELRRLVEVCADDVNKFNNGNRAAGTRVRKAMQDIKSQAQEVRKAVLGKKDK